MHSTTKRLLALLLALIFSVSLLPTTALAEAPGEETPENPAEDGIIDEPSDDPDPTDPADDPEDPAEDGAPDDPSAEPDAQLTEDEADLPEGINPSGKCGDNLTWVLTEDGVLTISGTGTMWDFGLNSDPPKWSNYSANITAVVIESGATSVGSYAFVSEEGYPSLSSVSIPATVESIGERAFYNCTALTSATLSAGLKELGKNAFAGTALIVVTIPQTVTTIGASVFANCSDLHRLSFLGDAPSIASNAFNNVTATAYYPGDNDTWTSDVMQDYGGTITWRSSVDADLFILGTAITSSHTSGLLDDSFAYTYDPSTKVLSLQGSYTVQADDANYVIKNKGVDGLTIRMDSTVRLYAPADKDMSFLVLNADTTIKSASGGYQLQIYGSTGYSTGVQVGSGVSLRLEEANLYLSGLTYGLLGSDGSSLTLSRSTGSILAARGAVRTFSGGIYLPNCAITEPENFTIGSDSSICKSDGTTIAPTVKFEPYYALVIDGVPVTDDNRSDVLSNGVFSFDGVHTLTVSGNYTGTAAVLIDSKLPALVVNTPGAAVLKNGSSAEETALIRCTGDLFLTGNGNLFLQHGDNAGDSSYGIRMEKNSMLRLQLTSVSIKNVAYGLSGSEDGYDQSLDLYKVNLTINAFTAAVTGFDGGITKTDCAYIYPAYTIAQDGALGLDSIVGFAPIKNVDVTSQTAYDLVIDGTRVYAGNKDNIRSVGVFAYDPDTNTLTVSGTYAPEAVWAASAISRFQPVIDNGIANLTILVAGDTTLTGYLENYNTYTPVVNSSTSFTIKGAAELDTPVLKLTASSATIAADGIHAGGDLTLENVKLLTGENENLPRYGILGSGGALTFRNACAEIATDSVGAAVTGFDSITLVDCAIVSTGVSVDGGSLVTEEGLAHGVRISNKVYDLYVDGMRFYADHLSMLDGRAVYDPETNTLTLDGLGEADFKSAGLPYIENHIPDLTIVIASGIKLSSTSTETGRGLIESDKDLTITAPGDTGRLALDGGGTADGIRMLSGADLTVIGARLLIQNAVDGMEGSTGSGLTLSASWVELHAAEKAVYGFTDGITLEVDEIKAPATAAVDGDHISDAGAYAKDVTIEPPEHYHDEIAFTPWMAVSRLPSEPGSYVLYTDVTLSDTWTVPQGTVNLCLNGHDIMRDGSAKFSVIEIMYGSTLNLYDCSETPGEICDGYADSGAGVRIVNGTFNMYGGKISHNSATDTGGGVLNLGTFNLYGGEISDNYAANTGGGVDNVSRFTMYGGKIRSNNVSAYSGETKGGGVYLSSGTFTMNGGEIRDNNGRYGGGVYVEAGSLQVSGTPVIVGNSALSGDSNVYLNEGMIITVVGELSYGAQIGVWMYTPGIFTSGYSSYNSVAPAAYFYAESGDYAVGLSDGEAKLTQGMHLVTFNVQGHGTAPESQWIGAGSPAFRPADPTEENWIFGGWYTEAACTHEYDFTGIVTENITLYAKWTENSVNYDLWLGETRVTSANAGDILGDGTASFDPETGTLTLNNANLTSSAVHNDVWCVVYAEIPLTIAGTGSISMINTKSAGRSAVRVVGNVTINGDISINVKYPSTGWQSYAVYAYGRVTVAGGNVSVTADGAKGFAGSSFCITGGELTVTCNTVTTYGSSFMGIGLDASNVTLSGGKATFNCGSYGMTVRTALNMTGGELNIEKGGLTSYGADLSFSGGTATLSGLASNSGTWTLTVENDAQLTVNSTVKVPGGIVIGDGLAITTPVGGKVTQIQPESGDPYYTVTEADGTTVASRVVIEPFTAYALWLGETQVTNANAGDILGDGTASFDPDTNTLTFTVSEPNITGLHNNALIYADGIHLKINATSTGLILSGNGIALDVYGNLTVNGNISVESTNNNGMIAQNITINGNVTAVAKKAAITAYSSLTITGNVAATSEEADAIYVDGKLKIDGSVTANGGTYGLFAYGEIIMASGTWDITGGEIALFAKDGITIPETHGISLPVNGIVASTSYSSYTGYTVTEADGTNIAKHAVIEPVSSYLPGDINGDGFVNNKDVLRLLRYVKDNSVSVVKEAVDVNGDGKVNNKDVLRLLRYVKNPGAVEIH